MNGPPQAYCKALIPVVHEGMSSASLRLARACARHLWSIRSVWFHSASDGI